MKVNELNRGFTLPELLVVVGVIGVLVALAFPALSKARAQAQRIHCVGHLKNVGLAYRIFATDNSDRFPWESTNRLGEVKVSYVDNPVPYFLVTSNELSTPKILVCPSDTRRAALNWETFTASNVSYFLGLDAAETYPQSILAGDRNITTNGVRVGPGLARISTNTIVGWDKDMHVRQGAVTMGDGSVQQMNAASFRAASRIFSSDAGSNIVSFAVP